MSFAVKFQVDGLAPMLRSLKAIKQSVANKHLRRGITKATRVIRQSAKAKVKGQKGTVGRERTGLLQKSIETKISVKGSKVVGLVGPKNGMKQQTGVRKRDGKKSKKGDPIMHDPVHIAHLVEFGHGGPHPAPAHPFLRPAFEETKGQAQTIIADELAAGIATEAGKG